MRDAVVLSVALAALCLLNKQVQSRPRHLRPRSIENHSARATHETPAGTQGTVHMADQFLADFMIQRADTNEDNKLSSEEIETFFNQYVNYHPYVSEMYGIHFINIADGDGDRLLDRDELLTMLVEMDAIIWTRR